MRLLTLVGGLVETIQGVVMHHGDSLEDDVVIIAQGVIMVITVAVVIVAIIQQITGP